MQGPIINDEDHGDYRFVAFASSTRKDRYYVVGVFHLSADLDNAGRRMPDRQVAAFRVQTEQEVRDYMATAIGDYRQEALFAKYLTPEWFAKLAPPDGDNAGGELN